MVGGVCSNPSGRATFLRGTARAFVAEGHQTARSGTIRHRDCYIDCYIDSVEFRSRSRRSERTTDRVSRARQDSNSRTHTDREVHSDPWGRGVEGFGGAVRVGGSSGPMRHDHLRRPDRRLGRRLNGDAQATGRDRPRLGGEPRSDVGPRGGRPERRSVGRPPGRRKMSGTPWY
jgi:hypothetical protein